MLTYRLRYTLLGVSKRIISAACYSGLWYREIISLYLSTGPCKVVRWSGNMPTCCGYKSCNLTKLGTRSRVLITNQWFKKDSSNHVPRSIHRLVELQILSSRMTSDFHLSYILISFSNCKPPESVVNAISILSSSAKYCMNTHAIGWKYGPTMSTSLKSIYVTQFSSHKSSSS